MAIAMTAAIIVYSIELVPLFPSNAISLFTVLASTQMQRQLKDLGNTSVRCIPEV